MGTYTDLKIINDSLNDIKTSVTNKGSIPSGNITTYATSISNIPTPMPVINREVVSGIYKAPTTSFTFSLPSGATDVGNYALYNAFRDCTGLTSVDFSSLTTISGNSAVKNAFQNCTNLTSVDLSSLTTISGNFAMQSAFSYTSLATLSFPALTSTSFGSYTNQFNYMLQGVTGCTVHFPSNLQSVIGSWSSVTGGFGGTNTTVLFDLPATT